jgi:hypothetical protein
MGEQMKVQSVRFGEELWKLVVAEAERDGVTPSQLVRDLVADRVAHRLSDNAKDADRSA